MHLTIGNVRSFPSYLCLPPSKHRDRNYAVQGGQWLSIFTAPELPEFVESLAIEHGWLKCVPDLVRNKGEDVQLVSGCWDATVSLERMAGGCQYPADTNSIGEGVENERLMSFKRRYAVNSTTLYAEMISALDGRVMDSFSLYKPPGWTASPSNQSALMSSFVPTTNFSFIVETGVDGGLTSTVRSSTRDVLVLVAITGKFRCMKA